MDLSKYLETMKKLPDRFSNLAFWRGVRKLKDKLVETFEYVGEWGNGIEGQILDRKGRIAGIKYADKTRDSRISALEDGARWLPIKNAVNTHKVFIDMSKVNASIERAFEGNFSSVVVNGNPDMGTVPLLVPNATITPLCLDVYFEYSDGTGDFAYFPVREYSVVRNNDGVLGESNLKITSIKTTSIPYNIPSNWTITQLSLEYQLIEPDYEGQG